jgi:hypothetical protein
LLPTLPFTRSVISHPRDLVTCCNIRWISSSVPRVSFRHAEEKIILLVHTPQPTPLEYLKTLFQSRSYRVTVDAIKAAAGCSDYNVTSQSKDWVTTSLIIATWTWWHDRVTILNLGMSIMALS